VLVPSAQLAGWAPARIPGISGASPALPPLLLILSDYIDASLRRLDPIFFACVEEGEEIVALHFLLTALRHIAPHKGNNARSAPALRPQRGGVPLVRVSEVMRHRPKKKTYVLQGRHSSATRT
jgi:hypothetical protein